MSTVMTWRSGLRAKADGWTNRLRCRLVPQPAADQVVALKGQRQDHDDVPEHVAQKADARRPVGIRRCGCTWVGRARGRTSGTSHRQHNTPGSTVGGTLRMLRSFVRSFLRSFACAVVRSSSTATTGHCTSDPACEVLLTGHWNLWTPLHIKCTFSVFIVVVCALPTICHCFRVCVCVSSARNSNVVDITNTEQPTTVQ